MSPSRPMRNASLAGMTVALLASSAIVSGPALMNAQACTSEEAAAETPGLEEPTEPQPLTPWDAVAQRNGFVTLAIRGSYDATAAQALLDRINAIRAEAAQEGLTIDGEPVSGTPLIWSTDLERVAQIRAAEASFSFSHERPNGTSTVYNKEGNAFCMEVLDENLAWYPSAEEALESWYAEKDAYLAYLAGDPSATNFSRYATLISNDYAYVGLGCFTLDDIYETSPADSIVAPVPEVDVLPVSADGAGEEGPKIVPGTGGVSGTAAESTTALVALFSATPEAEGAAPALPDGPAVQQIDVLASEYLSGAIEGEPLVYIGGTTQLSAQVWSGQNVHGVQNVVQGNVANGMTLLWQSSNPEVATVDENGLVSGIAPGSVTITLSCENVLLATLEMAVEVAPPTIVGVTAPATVTTPSGTAPELPASVAVSMSDETTTEAPVTWDAVDPTLYSAREGGTFAIQGTVEGWGEPVSITVTVEPATPTVAASTTEVTTEEGVAPLLPETAEVTWSNGDITSESITWNGLDPQAYATLGSHTVEGTTAGNLPVSCTVTVVAATIASLGVPAEVSTPSGCAPELPPTLEAQLSNGTTASVSVVWDAVDPTLYSAREGGTFAIQGTVEGYGEPVSVTVTVEPATVLEATAVEAACTEGGSPELPATVAVTWSNGDITDEAVTWNAPDASAYAQAGTVEVQGTVDATGTDALCTVTVEPLTPQSVDEPLEITGNLGSQPQPPATVPVTMSDGSVQDMAVTWNPVDPSAYAQPGTFEMIGTVEGTDLTVSCTVTVAEAIPIEAVAPQAVTTTAGTAPQLPATASVVMSDGTTIDDLPVTWEPLEPAVYSQAGTFTVTGTVADTGLTISCPVTVEDVTIKAVSSLEPLTVASGIAPELPTAVTVTLSDGTTKELPITWAAVDPSSYSTREGGTFEAQGTVEGWTEPLTVTVTVKAATPVEVAAVAPITTPAGTAPALPATANVTWSNGEVTNEAVTWTVIDPSSYLNGGTFTAEGTVANTSLTIEASVTVEDAFIADVTPLAQITTASGTAPELPTTVEVSLSNGTAEKAPVAWASVDPSAYGAREGGSFEVQGTVEGWDEPITASVLVEPAALASYAPLTATTEVAISPELPATASVTWSNGEVTNEAVTWEAIDPSALATVGTFDTPGTIATADGSIANVVATVTVNAPTVASVTAPASVTTPSGTAPELPAAVEAAMSNNTTEKLPVAWETVDPSVYSAREGGSFEVQGTAEGWDEPVTVSVTVEPATIASVNTPAEVSTIEGLSPALPAIANVVWSNGDTTDEAITWDAVDPSAYAAAGTFTVAGSIAGWETPIKCSVTVAAKTPTAVDAPAEITTPSGTAPVLPATASVSWDNNTTTNEDVTWDAIDPSLYSTLEGGQFTVSGSVAAINAPIEATVVVEAATPIEAAPEELATPAGIVPQLPATVAVSWSNGDTTNEAVAWDTVEEASLLEPGSLTVGGTFTNAAAQAIGAQAVITIGAPIIVGFEEIPDVSTTAGVRPQLPATVAVVMSDGTSGTAPVTWDEVPASAFYSAGTFTVSGTVEGYDEPAEITVAVDEPAVQWMQSVYVTTTVGKPPVLPQTIRLVWANGTQTDEPVQWKPFDPRSYAQPGTFTVEGTAGDRTVYASVSVTATPLDERPDIVPSGDATVSPAVVVGGSAVGIGAIAAAIALFVRRRLHR